MRLGASLSLCVLCLCGYLHGQPTTISGKVLDPDGKPAAEANVHLLTFQKGMRDPIVKRTVTATDGCFAFPVLDLVPAGMLVALKQGYGINLERAGVTADKTSDIQITLTGPGEVTGEVRDRANKPVENVKARVGLIHKVHLGSDGISWMVPEQFDILSATTGADGKFRIGSLPEGAEVCVTTRHPGYGDCRRLAKAGGAETKWILVPAARIAGRVVFEQTGQPAAGVTIHGYQDAPRAISPFEAIRVVATTDEKGFFVLQNLPPGSYTVSIPSEHCGDPEWVAVHRRVESLAEGNEVKCRNLVLTRGGIVSGKVTDRETGQPIETVHVAASPSDFTGSFVAPATHTQPDGAYKLRLPPGKWRVQPTGRGDYVTPQAPEDSRLVHLDAGATTEGVDFTLVRKKDGRQTKP